jgi:hypothetical protein
MDHLENKLFFFSKFIISVVGILHGKQNGPGLAIAADLVNYKILHPNFL